MMTLQFKLVSQTNRVLSDILRSCSYWNVQTTDHLVQTVSGGGSKKLIVIYVNRASAQFAETKEAQGFT